MLHCHEYSDNKNVECRIYHYMVVSCRVLMDVRLSEWSSPWCIVLSYYTVIHRVCDMLYNLIWCVINHQQCSARRGAALFWAGYKPKCVTVNTTDGELSPAYSVRVTQLIPKSPKSPHNYSNAPISL
jgi:hypothetical protein